MKPRSIRFRVGVAAVVVAGLGGASVAAAAGGSARSAGPDFTYDATFARARARVHVVRTGSGGTHVTLHVTGVAGAAGRTFGAHVHQRPCGPSGGAAGPHYQHAGAVGDLEQRELWLDFTVNAAGNGHAVAVRPWALDESSPRSVIVHALATDPVSGAAGARLACIDLDGDPR
jgi:Cu-Zn family superoxide dismutase